MTLLSRLVGRLANLPPAKTHAVFVERDLKIVMPDGVVLLADRYVPRGGERPPTILVRCPYGRRGFFGLLFGRLFAERGFQVLVQSTRGTFGSGGEFDPFGNEHEDGLATVAWLKQQPWFSGVLATTGLSYLGLVQWAIGRDAGADIQAMAIQVSTSNFRDRTYAGGSFGLETALSWTHLMAFQEKRGFTSQMGAGRKLRPLYAHLPLRDLDLLATGQHSPFFQAWLDHPEEDSDYWQGRIFDKTLKDIAPLQFSGNSLVGGHTTATCVAPERLHRVEVRTKRDVGGIASPGAQVAVFLAIGASVGDPAKVRRGALGMRVRHGLGILMTTYNREAIEVAIAIAIVGTVDEVPSATSPSIGDIGHIGIGHVCP